MGKKLQAGLTPSQEGSQAQQTEQQEKNLQGSGLQTGIPTSNSTTVTYTPGTQGTSSGKGVLPPTCAQLLSQAQTQLGRVTNDQSAVNADIEGITVLGSLVQSLVQQATQVTSTQAQLDAAHQAATQLQAVLTDCSTHNTDANGAQQNIYQVYNQAFTMECHETTQISTLMGQVNAIAAATQATYNTTLVYALLAQGVLDIQHPGPQVQPPPQTPAPPIAPLHLSKSGVTVHGNVFSIKLDESDTQGLLAALKTVDGGNPQNAFINTLIGFAVSYGVTVLASGGTALVPAPAAIVAAILKLALQLQAQQIAAVMVEADNHKMGVTFNFGIAEMTATYVAAGFVGPAAAAAAWGIAEVNLLKEQTTPGGCGSDIDVFWITGNTN